QKIPVYPPGKGNPGQRIANLQNQIATEQGRLLAARTASARNSHLNRINSLTQQLNNAINAAGKPSRYDTKKYLVEFQNNVTVQVRTMVLPEVFDDKGNPKTYTAAEKLALKGKDKKAPGY